MTRDIDELDEELERYEELLDEADSEAETLLASIGHDITAWAMEADEEMLDPPATDITPAQELAITLRNEDSNE
ncbi:hypothetical protein HAPG_00057 [Halorubrum phage GNf2]|nr:hypothetical protein HAPG_00057 [Halorubrum phage GNf2]